MSEPPPQQPQIMVDDQGRLAFVLMPPSNMGSSGPLATRPHATTAASIPPFPPVMNAFPSAQLAAVNLDADDGDAPDQHQHYLPPDLHDELNQLIDAQGDPNPDAQRVPLRVRVPDMDGEVLEFKPEALVLPYDMPAVQRRPSGKRKTDIPIPGVGMGVASGSGSGSGPIAADSPGKRRRSDDSNTSTGTTGSGGSSSAVAATSGWTVDKKKAILEKVFQDGLKNFQWDVVAAEVSDASRVCLGGRVVARMI